jgi:hypothetical protein
MKPACFTALFTLVSGAFSSTGAQPRPQPNLRGIDSVYVAILLWDRNRVGIDTANLRSAVEQEFLRNRVAVSSRMPSASPRNALILVDAVVSTVLHSDKPVYYLVEVDAKRSVDVPGVIGQAIATVWSQRTPFVLPAIDRDDRPLTDRTSIERAVVDEAVKSVQALIRDLLAAREAK